MSESLYPIAIVVVTLGLSIAIAFVVMTRFFHRAPANHVLVRSGMGGPRIATDGIVAIPFLHAVDVLDLSVRPIAIERRGPKGLLAENGDRVELVATFFVKVNATAEDMLRAVREMGCDVVNDDARFRAHVEPKLGSALEMVTRKLPAYTAEQDRDRFKDAILASIDLGSGLALEDLSLEGVIVVPDVAPPYR